MLSSSAFPTLSDGGNNSYKEPAALKKV
jgi:hypothetical protein